jgi:integrase
MASFQPNENGTVRVQVDVQGKRASKTLPNMRAARAWASDKERELEAQVGGDLGHGKTLGDALRKFAEDVSPTRRSERNETVRLAAFARAPTPDDTGHGLPVKKPIGQVSDDDLRAWRDRRLKKNKRSSVLRDMTLLSAVFEHARTEWKWIKENPLRDVKKPSRPAHRKRVISGVEARAVLRMLGYVPRAPVRTVSQAVAVAFLVALATGMRAGELCGLRWDDMKDMYGTAHNVKARERGVSRDVPLSKVARRLIERMRGWDDETVFGVGVGTLDSLFRRARKRAGYDDFTFHDARHSAATRIALSGKLSVLELCKVFGWSNPKQAMTYFNPTADELAAKLG